MPRMMSSGARGRELWTIGLLLFVSVVVPTAGVLWFMTRAMDNERLAVRQKLEDAYRGQIVAASERLEGYWADKVEALTAAARTGPAPEVFGRLVRDGVADGVVVYDASGQPAYPTRIDGQVDRGDV